MSQDTKQKQTIGSWIFPALTIVTAVVYAYFSFNTPTTAANERFGLVGLKLLLIQITFIIPYVTTWVIGAFAASNLKRRANYTTDPLTKLGYQYFSTGITFLVIGTMIAQIVALPRSFYPDDVSVITLITIVTNYINVFFPLIGFAYFFIGAKQFFPSLKIKSDIRITSTVIVTLLGSIYTLLVFTNSTRQIALTPDTAPTYYIPDILIILTIVIPILITWFFGFNAALTMGETPDTDSLEQKGFSQLTSGIWLIVFSSIILQGIVSLGSERFLTLGIGLTLLLIYFFLFVICTGYFLVASGSRKLLT
jgi:hypothetical protein